MEKGLETCITKGRGVSLFNNIMQFLMKTQVSILGVSVCIACCLKVIYESAVSLFNYGPQSCSPVNIRTGPLLEGTCFSFQREIPVKGKKL